MMNMINNNFIVNHRPNPRKCSNQKPHCYCQFCRPALCCAIVNAIEWMESTLVWVSAWKSQMCNLGKFHFMHRCAVPFVHIGLCVVLMNRIKNNEHAHLLPLRFAHFPHTPPSRSLILMHPYRSLSQASICHSKLSYALKKDICCANGRIQCHWIPSFEWIVHFDLKLAENLPFLVTLNTIIEKILKSIRFRSLRSNSIEIFDCHVNQRMCFNWFS